jgi:hypothetical protein
MDSDDVAALERLIAKNESIDLVHRYSYCLSARLGCHQSQAGTTGMPRDCRIVGPAT